MVEQTLNARSTTMSTKNNTQTQTDDFYVQLYFNYVTGDETVILINRTMGIDGVTFWIWLNSTMAKYDGLFTPFNLDSLLYTKEDKDKALNYISEFKKLNVLWETPEHFFTTTFLRDNAFKRIPEAKRHSLRGGIRTKGKTDDEIKKAYDDIERQVAEYFEPIKHKYDRLYPIARTACYMDLMYDEVPEAVEVEEPVSTTSTYTPIDDDVPDCINFDELLDGPTASFSELPTEPQMTVQEDSTKQEIEDKLKAWGLYQTQISEIMSKTTVDKLNAYIKMTEANATNKGAYFTMAVTNNWNVSKYLDTPKPIEKTTEPVYKTASEEELYQIQWVRSISNIADLIGCGVSESFKEPLKTLGWEAFKADRGALSAARWAQKVECIVKSNREQLLERFAASPQSLEGNISLCLSRPDLSEGILDQLDE